MLISPTEPKRIKALGKSSSTPEKYGADILILGKKKRIGVQRKQFPSDFLSSINDSRLYRQIPRLMDLEYAILVIEGHGKWTEDGELIGDNQWQSFTMDQFLKLRFSIMFEYGIPTVWVRDMNGTIQFLEALDAWAKKDKHRSLQTRPGPTRSSWGKSTRRHMATHIMQGFPGVGPELAGRIIDEFGAAPLTFTHSVDELMRVEGLGEKKAQAMIDALEDAR